MSVDLLRQQSRWKEALVSLREMMTSLIQQVHTCSLFCKWLYWVVSHERLVLTGQKLQLLVFIMQYFRFKVNVNLQLSVVLQHILSRIAFSVERGVYGQALLFL